MHRSRPLPAPPSPGHHAPSPTRRPPLEPQAQLRRGRRTVAYAGVVANITGNPAMSVPLWWNGEGLLIGVHFLGRFGDEATLVRLAAQLEAARPWAHRTPPVTATRPVL